MAGEPADFIEAETDGAALVWTMRPDMARDRNDATGYCDTTPVPKLLHHEPAFRAI